ncbi:BTB-POZ domain protein [Pyrenophora tritici-repentis]|uniref:BTB/POZ domain containing protein n=1 Tax=Pyrenophora tritici-repentis TaxID=45151 RepID=A0A2W1GCU1_9PLEO|nr:BTB-POZ domain protein [Pyrenophora tritici-repentis]KAI0571756.1 BTB-POZ domain protein [Pyrenophora tritici-repentis]KAI0571871.1 BTB-POZ domain protein [Pyrenophora tritici-repentis]KAI0605007.1 BTB-POZ domain protein [Pyrenophora tritici-repentis]KAI0617287.1 BTB-POZ domain protein [Pyrenophora tritici-repentis]
MSTPSSAHLDDSSDDFSMHSDEEAPVLTCTDPSLGYQKYFNCKKLSDVIIKYGSQGEHTFHGHRVLLATQSQYFDKLFNKVFTDVKEVVLEEDDPEMVEVILKLAYGHQPQSPTLEGTLENVLFVIHLFEISTKYEFSEFEELAVIGFTVSLNRFINQTANGQGPTFVELTTIIESVYEIQAGRLIESLIQILTTNPHVCAFRTWDSLSLLVLSVARQESRFEGSLREEFRKVRPSEHEALDGTVLTKNCTACDVASIKPSGMGEGGICLTCGALFSARYRA